MDGASLDILNYKKILSFIPIILSKHLPWTILKDTPFPPSCFTCINCSLIFHYFLLLPFLSFEWVINCCKTPNEQFFSNFMVRTSYIWWDENDVCFVLDQYANFIVFSLTRSGFGSTINSARCKQVKNYTTDAVSVNLEVWQRIS